MLFVFSAGCNLAGILPGREGERLQREAAAEPDELIAAGGGRASEFMDQWRDELKTITPFYWPVRASNANTNKKIRA